MAHTQGAVMAAARQLFSEKGYDGTTMDEIARAAGVSKATLYRHVPSKEALRDLLAPHLPHADLESRDARSRILEATMELIGRQGFVRTSLDEIAAVAGVSKGAIYWHFKGKDEILATILADYSPFSGILAVLGDADVLSFEEVVRRIYRAYLDFVEERADFFRAMFAEIQVNPELGAIFQRNAFGPLFAALDTYLTREETRQQLVSAPTMLILQALMGPLVMHVLTRNLLDRQLGLRFDRRQVEETFLGIFFGGVYRAEGSSGA